MTTIISNVTTQNDVLALEDVKQHLRVAGNDDDILIETLMQSAIDYCNNYLGRVINSRQETIQIREYKSDDGAIILKKTSCVVAINSVKDAQGNNLEYSFSDGELTLTNPPTTFTVLFTVTPILVDKHFIVSACYLFISKLYEQRGDESQNLTKGGWETIDRLLDMAAVIQI